MNLYTKDNCPQCMMTKRYLDENNISYHEINIENNLEAKQYLLKNNLLQLPVIECDNDFIVGFQPQKFQLFKGDE